MRDYLSGLQRSLNAVLDFPGTLMLHGEPAGNPWRVPILDMVPAGVQIQSEVELLCVMWALVVMLKPALVIETGSHVGAMTRALGQAVALNDFGKVLSAEVDGSLVERARKFCSGLPVEIQHGPALNLPIEQADVLFLDSSYESRKQELRRVRPGAIAIVHDTVREPQMAAEVAKYARRIEFQTARGFTIVQK
jgi:predicted O-methyltransferase YrrM